MSPASVLEQVHGRGIVLTVDAERHLVATPASAITPALDAFLRAHRDEIILALDWDEAVMLAARDASIERMAAHWVPGAADGDVPFADAWDGCTLPFHQRDRLGFLAALQTLEDRARYLCRTAHGLAR